MPIISIYYSALDNFAYPLLFWGLSLALLQFSFDAESSLPTEGKQTMKNTIKSLISDLWLLWLAGVILVGIYMLVKLFVTAIGWVAIQIGRTSLFGKPIPEIDGWVGIGSIILSIVAVFIIIWWITRNRKRKKETTKGGNNNDYFHDHFQSVL